MYRTKNCNQVKSNVTNLVSQNSSQSGLQTKHLIHHRKMQAHANHNLENTSILLTKARLDSSINHINLIIMFQFHFCQNMNNQAPKK